MTFAEQGRQRIGRLASIDEIEAALANHIRPLAPVTLATEAAVGGVLATDVVATADRPGKRVALRDGWAVRGDETAAASGYAPALLSKPPQWVDAGEPLPVSCDAVLPPEAVSSTDAVEALEAAASGEGVLTANFDATAGAILMTAGTKLRTVNSLALQFAGIGHVAVRRARLGLFSISGTSSVSEPRNSTQAFIAAVLRSSGAEVLEHASKSVALQEHLPALAKDVDLLVTIGGTGEGRFDQTVSRSRGLGTVLIHGMAIRPGETAALGLVDDRPILMLPARWDAALAAWLNIGTSILRVLTACAEPVQSASALLERKIASTIGFTEIVLVEERAGRALPLAASPLPAWALARATGWVLVPPQSEGFAAGEAVLVRPLF